MSTTVLHMVCPWDRVTGLCGAQLGQATDDPEEADCAHCRKIRDDMVATYLPASKKREGPNRLTATGNALNTEGMIKTSIRQTRGPKLVFAGRKIAETEFTTQGREPLSWMFEIWQTAGGAYIAVSSSLLAERDDAVEDVRCTVVEPDEHGGDQLAMQFAVMDHFDWTPRAKDMVRKQLKWKLSRDVQ